MEELMKDYYGKENKGKKQYISKEMFEQTIRALNESLKEIEKEKKKKTNQKAIKTGINCIISSVKNFYSSIKSNLEQLDWGTKRGIIKALIGRIDIGHEQVEIGFQIEEPAEDGRRFLICIIVLRIIVLKLFIYLRNLCSRLMTKNLEYSASHCLNFRTMCTLRLLKLLVFKLKRAYKSFKTV